MTLSLRPYQSNIVNAIRAAYAAGKRAPLVVLPTGGGKTTIFSYVSDGAAKKGRRVCLLAHRAELVKQIAMTLAKFGTPHGIIAPGPIIRQCQVEQFRAFGRTYVTSQPGVFVASAQTLIKRLDQHKHFDLIVIDEAHHLTQGSTWGRTVEAYPTAKLLPVTATPCRLDGRGLGIGEGGFADEMIMGPTMAELIEAGFLSPYRLICPPMKADLQDVPTRAGDYAKDKLAGAMDKPTITGDAVEHYQRLAGGKRAVVFCVSIGHAQHVASEFKASGVPAEFLDGTLDALERDRIIKRFETGETLVLSSCDLVSEGFDLPAIEVAILLRPTKSLALYLQQVGRALRTFPGKTEAIIIDHVGNCGVMTAQGFKPNHGLPDEEREWSLEGVTRTKRQAANDNQPPVPIATCPKCFTVHRPAPACPNCGHTYPVRERQVEQQAGELVELSNEQLEQMRRQRRVMQGQAKTIEELIAQGISRGRALKIVAAREAKDALRNRVMDALDALLERHQLTPHKAIGVTLAEIRRQKPKELQATLARAQQLLQQLDQAEAA